MVSVPSMSPLAPTCHGVMAANADRRRTMARRIEGHRGAVLERMGAADLAGWWEGSISA